jgi:voltage-gated sodium channel
VFLFAVELGMRWASIGAVQFWQIPEDFWWNVLDVTVVVFGTFDALFEALVDEAGDNVFTNNISILRVLRVLRIVRVARVIRVMPFFTELRMMVFSIIGSLSSLLWVLLVLGLMFFMFGIILTHATIAHVNTYERLQSESSLHEAFGTLDRSVLSLYQAMSGGVDWGDTYDVLKSLSLHYRLIFLVFISMALFAVVNIVIGIFVESARKANDKDRDMLVEEQLRAKKAYLESMKAIFDEMDVDGSGCITLAEFERRLDDERVMAYFSALKLDVSDATILFQLLDFDHSDEVTITEFLSGCYKLQGESRTLDMKIMQAQVQMLLDTVYDLHDRITNEDEDDDDSES